MTATTLPRDARLNVALFSVAPQGYKPKMHFERRILEGKPEPVDVLVVEELPVFRSGTFRDSMGFQHTYETIHIDQMLAHFNLLKDRGIFADVPVRAGHPSFLGADPIHSLMGYHNSLRVEQRTNPVDGKEYTYLLATFEITDPVSAEKVSSGLWRNVSAEVGPFLSNDEAEFWPVYQGVAYVDIPAVEGLKGFSKHNGVGTQFSLMLDHYEEAPVGETTATTTPPSTGPNSPAPQTAQDTAYHSRAQFVFSIAGKQTTDFAAVQAHITSLEAQNATLSQAATETKLANRRAFIKGLAEGQTPKILASQIPNVEGYALNMDDASWTAFQQAYENAPALSAVSNHSQTADGSAVNASGTSPVGSQPTGDAELDTAVEVIKQFKMQGMKPDKIRETPSFAKVKAKKPDHPILQGIAA